MRLIDADVAQRIADKELFVDEAGAVQFVLSHCPAIEVEPVKHSKWKYTGCFLCECQNCGEIYSRYANDGKDWNYCPNCGAKMDGGADNG